MNHKLCVVCSKPLVPKPDTFETRQLCFVCRDVWDRRNTQESGYKKDA